MASPDVDELPLKLYFIPYLAPGHIIPLCDIARYFSSRGHHVTVITTPANAQNLHHSISNHFHVHTIPFPSQQVGLPDGVENMSTVTDLANSTKVYEATTLLRGPMEQFVEQYPPDCIVADFLYPWVDDLANKLHIPRLAFNGFSLFALCAFDSLFSHPIVANNTNSYVIQDFPHHITMNATPPKDLTWFLEQLRKIELKSYGLIVNSFVELDGEEYVEHYEKTTGHNKAWHLGPASLIRKTTQERAERGQKSVVNVDECLSWLDSKPPNSVLYICFGSLCHFLDEQQYEMACGIEASGHPFIWVVPEKKGKEDDETKEEKWLPEGFEERTKKKGMIIRGWAPQVLILGHHAIGAFLTHCGWNSTVEAVSAGVPMITWPVHSEQFYNEKLITQVRGIGVELGAEEWNNVGSWKREKLMMGRDRIEKAVRRLMDGGDEAEHIRKRARELGKKAREVVQKGGSSHNNLMALIHNLKQLRHRKSLDS